MAKKKLKDLYAAAEKPGSQFRSSIVRDRNPAGYDRYLQGLAAAKAAQDAYKAAQAAASKSSKPSTPTAQRKPKPAPAPKTVTSNIPEYQPQTQYHPQARGQNMDIFSQYATTWKDQQLGFGKESYDAAKAAGLTDFQLQQGLAGRRVGKVALQRINEGTDVFGKFATTWNDQQLGFGKESYEAALRAGITNRQMQAALAGKRVGKVALERINQGVATEGQPSLASAATGNADTVAKLRSDISDLTANFANQMQAMQGSFAQSLASYNTQRERVQGIRTADRGTGGATQQQLQRRGVKGTFGRSGDRLMKISSLNV